MRNAPAAGAVILLVATLGLLQCSGGSDPSPPAGNPLTQFDRQSTKDFQLTLFSHTSKLTRGQNKMVLEFKDAPGQKPVDPGEVQLSLVSQGSQPGEGKAEVQPGKGQGIYDLTLDVPAPGTWDLIVRFSGQEVRFPLQPS